MVVTITRSTLHILTSPRNPYRNSFRSYYYKFKRVLTPPLPEPKESPYIVGPYLKPKYLPATYITEPIKHRNDNDLDYFIYVPTKIETDESRKVELLLIEDVEGLGVTGQVVEAPYRFAASKLVAMKKAEYATDFAQKWYKFGPRTVLSASSALSPKTARLLKSQIFTIPISKSIPIQPWHLILTLRMAGFLCPQEAIEKDSINEKDELIECTIRINNHERVPVRFQYVKKGEESEKFNDLS